MFSVKRKRVKLNNDGSTLVLAVASIAFIAILAFTILAAASSNLMLKRTQILSNKAFYTAETALDEIYTGLGVRSLNTMNESYLGVASNLLYTDVYGIQYMKTNEEANKEVREQFIKEMYKNMTTHEWSSSLSALEKMDALSHSVAYLSECIQNVSTGNTARKVQSIKIDAINDIETEIDGADNKYYIVLKDVKISYLESNDYFAEIITDIQIAYPNMTINFTEASSLKDFLYYTIITDENIAFTGSGTAVVDSSIYAGNNIELKESVRMSGVNATVTGGKAPADEPQHINVVSRENILLSKSNVALSLVTTDVWVKNFIMQQTATGINAVNVTSDEASNMYVEDDLEINSDDSAAVIKGSYYGYSYTDSAAASSSAVILNGKQSRLDMQLKDLVLGGRSYVNISTDNTYATGESISAKGDQDVYLVLDKYFELSDEVKGKLTSVGASTSVSNPMSNDSWERLKTAVEAVTGSTYDIGTEAGKNALACYLASKLTAADSDFFAYKYQDASGNISNLLNPTQPVTVKQIAHGSGYEVYIYYNFADKGSSNKYIEALLAADYADKTNPSYVMEKEVLNTNIKNNISNISITATGDVYSNSTIIQSADRVNGISGVMSATAGPSDFGTIQPDLVNRAKLLRYFLTTVPKNDKLQTVSQVVNAVQKTKNGAKITESQFNEAGTAGATYNDISKYILSNKVGLANYPDPKQVTVKGTTHAYNLIVVAPGQTVEINTDKIKISGGEKTQEIDKKYGAIIICYGNTSNTYINSDFVGMIVSQGNVEVRNDATVCTNQSEVLNILSGGVESDDQANGDNDIEIALEYAKYFSAFESSIAGGGTSIQMANLQYSDLVSIVNWRK